MNKTVWHSLQSYRNKASDKRKLIYILNIKHQIREPSAQMNGKKIHIHCHYVEHDWISHLLKWVSDYCMNSINNLTLLICILIRIIVWVFNHTLHQGCLVCCSNIAAMLLRYVYNSRCVASSPLNFAKNIQLEIVRRVLVVHIQASFFFLFSVLLSKY